MRRSFDGLHALVTGAMQLDAFAGHLFLFASRRRDRVKILYWDRDGFAVWSKRLEEGTYVVPFDDGGAERRREITAQELGALLSGIDLSTANRRKRYKGVRMETTMAELAPYMRGWRSYFGFCETPEVLVALTRWVRLRLRAALWRQWKTPHRRRAALLELGVREPLASNTAGSGRGPWYLAKAKALAVALSNAYFKSLGLPSLFEDY